MRKKRVMLAALCVSSMVLLHGCSLIDEQWEIVENYRLENSTTEEKKAELTTTEPLKKQDVLEDFLNTEAMTLAERIDTPNGYKRVGEVTKNEDKDSIKQETSQEENTTEKVLASTSLSTNTEATSQSSSFLGPEMRTTAMDASTQQGDYQATSEAAATTEDVTSKRDNTSGATFTIEEFMRNLDVKTADSKVLLYNGEEKENQDSYVAILNLSLDERNLQQKASSVMRLYAEYYWTNRDYDNMKYHLNSGFEMDYATWIQGQRVKADKNSASWYEAEPAGDDYPTLLAYLETYFCYSGMSAMLSDSIQVTENKVCVGDYFIDDNMENAAMVIDVAEDANGNQCFLLATGGVPGQDIEILKNPAHEDPWYYSEEIAGTFETPEFTLNGDSRWHLIDASNTTEVNTTKNQNSDNAGDTSSADDTTRSASDKTTQSATGGTTQRTAGSTTQSSAYKNATTSANSQSTVRTTVASVATTKALATTSQTATTQRTVATTESTITRKSMASESEIDTSVTPKANGMPDATTQSVTD